MLKRSYTVISSLYLKIRPCHGYYRKSADQTLLVIGNYKTQQQTLTLPSKLKHIVLNNLPQLKTEGNEIMLEGYQAVILEMLS